MGLLSQAMTYYSYVFHPITVLGACTLVLIYYEWAHLGRDRDRAVLYRRVGAFLGAGVLALLPTVSFFLFTAAEPFGSVAGNNWRRDALVAAGLYIAAGTTWYLWNRYEWGPLVPDAMEVLAAVTLPYIVLSPLWNVSGHVVIALMPTMFLTLVDRRFWPLLLIPVLMVPNRVYLDAHTVSQTLVGFLVTAVIVGGVYWLQSGRRPAGGRESVTQ